MVKGILALRVLTVLLILVLSPQEIVSDTVPVIFYPFGTDQGDTIAPVNDDGYTSAIPISSSGFPFFGNNQHTVFVNTNGGLSFQSGFGTFTPTAFPLFGFPLIAPFWADIDTRQNNGRVYYRQSAGKYNMTVNDSLLMSDQVNTFQCVLVTNSENSFAMFNYARLTWTTGTASGGNASNGLGGTPAQVGFNAGDATNYYAVPTSRTANIVDIWLQSNIGITGRWIFRVDQAQIATAGCRYTPACTVDARTGLCAGSGLCSFWGDPHYTSFDGHRFDYQGVCKHLLVGLLPGQDAGTLSSFQVFGRNEYRYGYTAVSWFHDVEIVYGNDSIQLIRGASLSVSAIAVAKKNGFEVNLPYCESQYSIYFSGSYVRYQTTFGLAVETDGFTVNIYVPSTYRSLLTGLCGNFDGASTNDLVYNNIDYSSNPEQFGDFFIFPETGANSSTPLPQSYVNRCQQLVDLNGPFGPCLRSMDAAVPGTSTATYNDCLLDACFSNESVICQHVFNLVEVCAFRGFQIDCDQWQTATQCPVVCPAGMVFECNSSRVCMPTCDNPIVSAGCTRAQRAACVCPIGQLLDNGVCTSSCASGCVDSNFIIHPVGDVWNRTGCFQLTCGVCTNCLYGHRIGNVSACTTDQYCSNDGQCVTLTSTPTTSTTTTTATTTTTPTTTPTTTTPYQRPNAYFIFNANGGVLTYGPDSNSLNGLALMTTDNILQATPFVFITPCLSAQVPNANLSSGQCVTLQAADGSSLIAVNVMGGVSMMSWTNMHTQFSCEFNVDASVFLRRTQSAQNVFALQSIRYTAYYYSSSGVSQSVFMYYNNNSINNNNYQQQPSITSYYFMLTYTGFSTVSTTCPNVWTLTNMARPVSLGSPQGTFSAAYCRQLCLVYPNCVGVTIQSNACLGGIYPCYFTIAGTAGQSLVIDPNYIHYDLNPTYPSRCAGECMITWTTQTVTLTNSINPRIYFTTSRIPAADCRDQCRTNSSCMGIRWSAVNCIQYFRSLVVGAIVPVGSSITVQTPIVNSVCDKSSPVIHVLSETSDFLAEDQPDVNGYDACYTLCMNNVNCTGFQLQTGIDCSLTLRARPSILAASSGHSYYEVRRSPSGNGCQNQWTLYSNAINFNSVPYVGPIAVQSEQDCRAACMSAALSDRSCVSIDYNQATNICRMFDAPLTLGSLNTDLLMSNGWNHFELTLSPNCFNGY